MEYSFIVKNNLKQGDKIIEHQDGIDSGFGIGVIDRVFSNNLFTVKFADKKLPYMFSINGIRHDKEGQKGAKRAKALHEQ